ncbi:MAG: hypothetical protein M3P24_08330 [Gemmatimonadota bacterium]|nr:hypothetical protein [Gemmatimonadota bacterium]
MSSEWQGWARGVLREAGHPSAFPFLEAVTGQVAHRGDPRDEWEVGKRALALLLDPRGEGAEARLLAEPPMLAAFFQNVDLLFDHHDEAAEPVAALVMRALEAM